MGKRLLDKKVKDEDLTPAAELFVSIFNEEPWNDEWTIQTARKRLKDFLKTPNFLGVYCYDQDELLGFALGNRERWFNGEVFHLKEMGVKRTRQDEGIGTELMEELRDQLSRTETRSIYLITARNSRAEKFYRKKRLKKRRGFDSNDRRLNRILSIRSLVRSISKNRSIFQPTHN